MKKQKEEKRDLKGNQAEICPEETLENGCVENHSEEKECDECSSAEQGCEDPECAEKKSLEEKISGLEASLKDAEAKLAKEKDDYVRLMAEFENFRRRSTEEKLALVSTASADTIKGLLPVLDDCERAMALLADSSDEAAKEGTGLIYDKLMKYLKTKGLEVIAAKGQKFDTDFHEAVAQVPVPEEDKKGMVYDVIETGYTLGGKILRYAKVVVGI